MKLNRDFFLSGPGQAILLGVVLVVGIGVVRWQRKMPVTAAVAAKPAPSVPLPKVLTREVAKFVRPAPVTPPPAVPPMSPRPLAPAVVTPRELPLLVITGPEIEAAPALPPSAPIGRMIPCETVVTLESSRLETPLVGLVTADVWQNGVLIVPAGSEVHGPASLDHARQRIAAQGNWRIVWRTNGPENGRELDVNGLALDRDYDAARGKFGETDGAAGLRGEVIKTQDERELKLFASTFLSTATLALQEFQPAAGLLGSASAPVASARNAVLAGTGAVLRDYAQNLKDAIARDGFVLRVPAGTPFYLYVTETLNRGAAPHHPKRTNALSQP